MQALLKSRLVLAVLALAVLMGVYVVGCVYLAPGLVRAQAQAFVRTHYARELAIGDVRIHPFKLQLEVRALALPDADGQPMLGCDRLFVDLELASLWNRSITLALVAVDAPQVRAVVRPGGALNLADLALPASEPAAQRSGGALPSVWVQRLQVVQGQAVFVDQARHTPFEQGLQNIAFELADFRTTPEGGDFSLSARSADNTSLEWKGHVALAPAVASRGEFKVGALQLPKLLALLGDAVPFSLKTGTLTLAGSYGFTLGAQTAVDLNLPSADLQGLALQAQGVAQPWVTVPAVKLSGVTLALPARALGVGRVEILGAKAQAWLNADRTLNLQALFAAPAAAASAPAPAPSAPARATPSWSLKLGELALLDAGIDVEDRAIALGTRFSVAPINLRVSNASLDLAQPLPVSVDAVVNQSARFEAKGTLTPAPLAASLAVRLDKARLSVLQPYVLPHADLSITAGEADAAGLLTLSPGPGGAPRIGFVGDIAMAGFKSVSNDVKRDFVNFAKVDVARLRLATDPAALQIERISVQEPYVLLTISPQQVFNVKAVLNPPGAAKAAAKPVAAGAQADAFPLRIGELRFDRMRMDFSDNFIQPNFAADVRQLSGTVTGLSSAPDSRAKVALEGRLGEFSPVSIQGEVQAFAFDRYTDMRLRFANISLPIFNPYSGPLAGYKIDKGQLTTELHYKIQGRRLAAEHKLRIDQLEWGEATPTQGGATLPVRFATALLKDRNGVIDLDVPVGGTLDDPSFRIAPIVWQIIGNLITKAVTAPFALLASAAPGAEEAQFVDFAPGDAALPAATASHLAALGKSLAEKPALKIDVPIGTVSDLDVPALTARAFDAALAAEPAMRAAGKAGAAAPVYAALGPAARRDVLTAFITARTGLPPQVPDEAAAVAALERQARALVKLPDTALADLGEQRALAIERALLAGTGLDAGRVFKVRVGKVQSQSGRIRFELSLQ
jgi:hypothetical protein